MKELKTLFIRWYFNQFVDLDPLYVEMSTVFEDSSWHRERTVAAHTNMVVGEYISMVDENWTIYDLYGAFVCAFHDVGKPSARTEVYKPERGTYYRYGGHELVSARLWEDWAVRNWTFLKEEFDFNPQVIYNIAWLIENHLPWSVKKIDKRRRLVLGVYDTAHYVDTFFNILKADSWGRVSDDIVEKRKNVNIWCEQFRSFFKETVDEYKNLCVNEDVPVLYIPIGVSGCGKSTLLHNNERFCNLTKVSTVDEILHFSMDVFRHEWYDSVDYKNAYKLSCEDVNFMNKVHVEFIKMVKTGNDIYSDNTNVSKKRRSFYIQQARKYGYIVKAILIPVTLETALSRQKTRGDKCVPEEAVKRQYFSLGLPSLGEVDEVIVYDGNIP